MTDRDIKFELSKIALANGMSIETIKTFYEWIMKEPEHEVPESNPTPWEDTPIEDLARRTRIEGTITKRCKDNGINTVGDLIRCGGLRFIKYQNVGRSTVNKIDDALEQYYNITDWYKM